MAPQMGIPEGWIPFDSKEEVEVYRYRTGAGGIYDTSSD